MASPALLLVIGIGTSAGNKDYQVVGNGYGAAGEVPGIFPRRYRGRAVYSGIDGIRHSGERPHQTTAIMGVGADEALSAINFQRWFRIWLTWLLNFQAAD